MLSAIETAGAGIPSVIRSIGAARSIVMGLVPAMAARDADDAGAVGKAAKPKADKKVAPAAKVIAAAPAAAPAPIADSPGRASSSSAQTAVLVESSSSESAKSDEEMPDAAIVPPPPTAVSAVVAPPPQAPIAGASDKKQRPISTSLSSSSNSSSSTGDGSGSGSESGDGSDAVLPDDVKRERKKPRFADDVTPRTSRGRGRGSRGGRGGFAGRGAGRGRGGGRVGRPPAAGAGNRAESEDPAPRVGPGSAGAGSAADPMPTATARGPRPRSAQPHRSTASLAANSRECCISREWALRLSAYDGASRSAAAVSPRDASRNRAPAPANSGPKCATSNGSRSVLALPVATLAAGNRPHANSI